jgi:Zn finger protein HypA/HybF involved in hydrogenase expression
MIIFIFICLVVGLFLGVILAGGNGIITLFSDPIECPACGRKIKVRGNSTRCYKCRSKLYKHANGQYMVRQ